MNPTLNEFFQNKVYCAIDLERYLKNLYLKLKLLFFRWGTRWHKIQNGLSVRGRGDVDLLRLDGNDSGDQGQLRKVLDRHLQQARLHGLERQLHVAENDEGLAKQVRLLSKLNSTIYFLWIRFYSLLKQ